jgi:hypothetical protein
MNTIRYKISSTESAYMIRNNFYMRKQQDRFRGIDDFQRDEKDDSKALLRQNGERKSLF